MAQKNAVQSNTTAGDRLLNVGGAALHLSTGELVFLAYDPVASAGNFKVSLWLATGNRTAPTRIALLNGTQFTFGGLPRALALCRDDKDNLYVVGQDASSGNTMQVGVQAFKKKTGLAWSQQKYLTGYYAGFAANSGVASNFSGFAAVWCNTGGGPSGAGHLFVIANEFALGRNWAFTISAGTALAGDITKGIIGAPLQPPNPYFMGTGGGGTTDGSNLDIAPDGFGATSGMSVAGNDVGHHTVGSWGVTNQGVITSGVGMTPNQQTCGTLARLTTKLHILRYAPGAWAVISPSATHAGQLTIRTYTAAGPQSSVDTGTPSNFPAPSATLNWGATESNGTVWIYGWSSVTATTMLRMPVNISGNVPTIGPVVSDDTGVGSGTPTTIRVVKDAIDAAHTDWQAYNTVSPYSLMGDYSALVPPPNQPALGPPTSGSVAALAAGGTLAWAFSSPLPGDVQTAYALRRTNPATGTVEWWTGATWAGAETFVASAAQQVVFAGGQWPVATPYSWSVNVKGSTGLQSGYAPEAQLVTGSTSPANPTLTAAYDAVNNLVTLTLHSADATGVNGSIEYSDDGGVTWTFVRNASALVVNPGTATVVDYEAPHGTRQYRARSWTAYPEGYSAYVTQNAVVAMSAFWLKDPLDGTSLKVNIKQGEVGEVVREDQTEHIIPGRPFSLVVAGAQPGKEVHTVFHTSSRTEDLALFALLTRQRVLLLQSPEPRQQYLRRTADSAKDLAQRETITTSHREHTATFVEAARP